MPTILSFGRMSHLIIPLYGSEKFAIYIQESQVSGPNIDNKASEYVGAFQINSIRPENLFGLSINHI